MSVVCAVCNTKNRDNAMFCMGCAGKLPAFEATAPSILEGLRSTTSSSRRMSDAPPALLPLEKPESWIRVGLLALAVTLAFMGWYAYVTRKVTLPTTPAAAVTAQVPVPVQPAPPASAAATAQASPSVPVAASLATGEIQVDPGPPNSQVPMVTVPAPQQVAPLRELPTQERSTAPSRYAAMDPRRGCENLNFVFAARCEAMHCDRSEFTHHPRCDLVRADRRRDEARRNPTLGY